jgi:plastocyanin
MICHSMLVIGVAAAIVVAHMGPLSAAGSGIAGTVKVTGVASNADAVVYIQQVVGTFPAAKTGVMDQRNFQFVPHVLPVLAGTTVKFLNSDPTPHNVFSPDNEKYNLGTWPQGETKDYAFTKCTKAPCVYTQLCRVHPEMEGYVVVLQNPYFVLTNKDGHYQIDNVPPGSYTVAVWHAKGKTQPKPVTVDGSQPATVDFVLSR